MKNKNYPYCYLLLLWLSLFGCQSTTTDMGIAKDYFPSASALKQGIVNKYYVHNKPNEEEDINTHLLYLSYQLELDTFRLNSYDDVYTKSSSQKISVKNDQFLLEEQWRFLSMGAFRINVSDSIVINWADQKAKLSTSVDYGVVIWKNNKYQEKNRDSIIMNQPAKIFEWRRTSTRILKGDTSHYQEYYKEIYVKGLGLYYQEQITDKGKYWKELVEQMPLAGFKNLFVKGTNRVAYIDTLKAMDIGQFAPLCNTHNKVFDYYNGQQILHYHGGKKAIWKIINQRMNKEMLFDESGYLTFRFIVNCEGQASRFVTEQAGLDFQKKQFKKETVQHLYTIMKAINDWIPTTIRDENVDAYFYLTFKLKDGQLIELLP